MVNLESVSFSYDRFSHKVLSNCTVKFPPRTISLVQGGNGSGKSTFMDIISGFKRPQKGKVLVNRVEMYADQNNVTTLRKNISYMPSALKLPAHLDVGYILRSWVGGYRSKELTELLGLEPFLRHKYLHLSDGYKNRVHLAIALSRGNIVLLDEPLKSQDDGLCKVFPKLMSLCSTGRTFIISSPIAIDGVKWDKVLKLKDGELK